MNPFAFESLPRKLVIHSAVLCLSMACSGVEEPETPTVARASAPLSSRCKVDELTSPTSGGCVRSDDRRSAYSDDKLKANPTPHDLAELRKASTRKERKGARSSSIATVPNEIPGGLGAGVSFNSGALQAHQSATLYTHMVVYPDGFGFDLPADFFTTSTNRTEKGVEVVGWYREKEIHHIGVFDWSCSVADPCSGGQTSPSWIWTRPFDSVPCHLTEGPDGNGRTRDSMYYANSTFQRDGRWQNEVSFWNYCTSSWDLVYAHSYGGTQQDCSVTGCGWWGPIIENFHDLDAGDPIPELGFFDTTLVHNGTTSNLSPTETSFNGPPSTWNLCYLEANHSWGTTPLPCVATSTLTASLTLLSSWNTGYCAEIHVSNGGTATVSSWAVDLAMNASSLSNSWNGTYTPTTAGHYRVAPVAWNASIPAGGSVSTGFCGAKTGAGWMPVVAMD